MKADYQLVYEKLVHMRRRFRPQVRRTRGFLDAAPMVDVALLLFLFFLVQSSFIVQPGIRIDLPAAAFSDGLSYRSLVVTMSQEGLIFFDDERMELDQLGAALAEAAANRASASLLIEADGGVDHESLVRVYSMAREAGIDDVVLATRVLSVEE